MFLYVIMADNWIFKVIEEFPCENEIQLRMREQYHYVGKTKTQHTI